MSPQIAILKILSIRADGCATLAALQLDLAFLAGSGYGRWECLEDLAAQGFLNREDAVWKITADGRRLLRPQELAPLSEPHETPLPPFIFQFNQTERSDPATKQELVWIEQGLEPTGFGLVPKIVQHEEVGDNDGVSRYSEGLTGTDRVCNEAIDC